MELLNDGLVIAGFASLVIAAVIMGRGRAKDETIDAQQSTIEAFAVSQTELRAQMDERERHCDREIAHLKGRVDALAEQQSEAVAGLLAPRIAEALIEANKSGRWSVQ